MFPVPLNSWKMTSSMREPVSTSAVPRMVRLPPPSILRAAPKICRGTCMVVRVEAARERAPDALEVVL